MFDTLILLTGPVEQTPLGARLQSYRPELEIRPVGTAEDLAGFDVGSLHRARLIGFVTPVIVPPKILNALGYGAYNFHPGPPDYPGWAPAHFATYDQATEFGVTVHEMAERVDSGAIVAVASFPVSVEIGVTSLESLAYARLLQLFWQLAPALATQAMPLPRLPMQWGSRRTSRQAYREICDIPVDIAPDELRRRVRAFGNNDFGIAPSIRLHGIEFRAVMAEPAD